MDGQPEVLGITVTDQVKANEALNKVDAQIKQMAGIAGTLHLTKYEDCGRLVSTAWELSKGTRQPVIIVVRATY